MTTVHKNTDCILRVIHNKFSYSCSFSSEINIKFLQIMCHYQNCNNQHFTYTTLASLRYACE